MSAVFQKNEYIIPISYSYSTQLKGKCLSVLRLFYVSRFPVDTEGKFCYDGIYSTVVGMSQCLWLPCVLSTKGFFTRFTRLFGSHIENHPLTEMYPVEPYAKGELPHAKETDHLHE